MKHQTVWIWVICVLLLCSLFACAKNKTQEPVVTPNPTSTDPQQSMPETVTDDVVFDGGEGEQPPATVPAQESTPVQALTPPPASSTEPPINTPAPAATPTPKSTGSAKPSSKATATPTAKPTPTHSDGDDITAPELGDDPTPSSSASATAKATPSATASATAAASATATATSGVIELPEIP